MIGGGTDLAGALTFVHIADGVGMRFIVISDGEPNDADKALRAAKRFTSRIDCVYVGPEGGDGQDFLNKLASMRGGSSVVADRATELADSVQQLLLTA